MVLGFVQTTTENAASVGQLFAQLKQRGMQYQDGLLFVIDGRKGLKKAIEEQFGNKAIIQRCCWHKRENILSYLPESHHDEIKREYHQALSEKTYAKAKEAMKQLTIKLKMLNLQAARSLEEWLEELLTLHKLGANEKIAVSFSTTNPIESLNSQLKKYTGRVTNWSLSEQRYRWVATALIKLKPE